MTEQPGDVLTEAVKLFDSLWRRIGGDDAGERSAGGAGERSAGGAGDDVWSRATAEDPHIATGAPECRNCPICRAIAMARESGPDVTTHVRQAGQSLMAAAFDVMAAFERTRAPRRPSGSTPSGGSRPAGGSRAPGGSSEDPWAAAARDEPLDIG
ncbi:hypothetical protein [Actinomadura rudentiformis]|uniref:Uncharacterized protein n=1 Tax=Actinomadura rudentiformis TaxID=359158 RepID=A0A6H9YEM5_9ACTN|nr:hypothetical protein [Actinomadura rudentiformis]KAB2342953.1 hypothetical protein F8566_35925 [Actinomadura rudentiformis]